MLKNYVTIAFRNLLKYKLYSLVNILGLAVGIAFCSLLFIIIRYELSFDQIHRKSDRIFRAVMHLEKGGVGDHSASVPYPLASTVANEKPEWIESYTQLYNFQNFNHSIILNEKKMNVGNFYFTDVNFFQIFDYPLEIGEPQTVFTQENAVVISDKVAKKYFDGVNPIGKKIIYENYDEKIELVISGVFSPRNYASHINFNFIANIESITSTVSNYKKEWFSKSFWTYFLLSDASLSSELEESFSDVVKENYNEGVTEFVTFELQALKKIYLHSDLNFELSRNGDVQYVYIFSVIGILTLIITIINFTNLSTARSSLRAREIGVRKAIGADQFELVQQFLVESLFISLIAIFFAFIIVETILPHISSIMNRDLDFRYIDQTVLITSIFSSGLLVGFISSIYPSYYLARFLPAEILGGSLVLGVRNKQFRSFLVIIQFVITIYLLISSMVSFQQVNYLRNTEIGFAKDRILILPYPSTDTRFHYEDMKQDLIQFPHIESVTIIEDLLGAAHKTDFYKVEGKFWVFPSMKVGYDFVNTFDMPLLAGRSFSSLAQNDGMESVIINEEMVKFMKWDSPEEAIGKQISTYWGKEKVVGVVENFHFQSLHQKVNPFVLDLPNDAKHSHYFANFLAIRISESAEDIKERQDYNYLSDYLYRDKTLNYIKKVWKNYVPNRQFEYFFLGKKLNNLYLKEVKLGMISADFSLVAIFISCLSLFGLAAFVVEQRKKEIAIRKAIGTTDISIVMLLVNEFLALVAISLLISWPFSYFMMTQWLQTFPFHAEISYTPFLVSGLLIFLITCATVSYHTIRAAVKDPVQDLNEE